MRSASLLLRTVVVSVGTVCLSGCATQRVHDAVSAIGSRSWEIRGHMPSRVLLAKDGSLAIEMPAICTTGWDPPHGKTIYDQPKYLVGTRRAAVEAVARAQRIMDPSAGRVQIVGGSGTKARYLLVDVDVREPGWKFVPNDKPGRGNGATDDMLPEVFRRPDVMVVAMYGGGRNPPETLPPYCYPRQDLPMIIEVDKGGMWMGKRYRAWWGYPAQLLHLPLFVADTAAVIVAIPVTVVTMPFWLPKKLSGI